MITKINPYHVFSTSAFMKSYNASKRNNLHEFIIKFYVISNYVKCIKIYFLLIATLTPQQIRAIRMENKFSDLRDKAIEEEHKKFIEAQ